MKTAISIPDPLFIAADKLADKLGVTRSALYAKALKDFIVRRTSKSITAQLNAVYGSEPLRAERALLKSAAGKLERDDRHGYHGASNFQHAPRRRSGKCTGIIE